MVPGRSNWWSGTSTTPCGRARSAREPVTLPPSRVDLVRTLNRRGIVNSVCSKNDPDRARTELERVGLWDELVFARIDWTPKGGRVAQIVADAQLRPEEVLFIDDLPLNREEVRHAVPGIQVADPEIIEGLLDRPQLAGKDDGQLTRLEQYRVLERKLVDRVAASGSNEAFLRSCDIRVGVFTDAESEADRLFELVNRTNQLNFTKRRPDREAFDALLADTRRRTGYVRVRDRLRRLRDLRLLLPGPRRGGAVRLPVLLPDPQHGCRAVALRPTSGRPSLAVVGEVAASPDGPPHGPVDWITRDEGVFDAEALASGDRSAVGTGMAGRGRRVLMVGGCDLTTAEQFLGRGHRHRVLPHRADRGLHLRGSHRDPPSVGRGDRRRPTDPGRPDPLPRPTGVRLAGRGRPRLRRAGVQRADRLHPGPLPPPSAGSGRPLAPVHRGRHPARPAGPAVEHRFGTGGDGPRRSSSGSPGSSTSWAGSPSTASRRTSAGWPGPCRPGPA